MHNNYVCTRYMKNMNKESFTNVRKNIRNKNLFKNFQSYLLFQKIFLIRVNNNVDYKELRNAP